MRLPEKTEALPGRAEKMAVPARHHVKGTPLAGPFPEGTELAMFGMGCFWGAEKKLWQPEGVYSTAVGYAAGVTPNPTYREVCSGLTGHSEVVRVAFDPKRISYDDLLRIFWESHDPTQGMRQGNDVGTQYRSGIYYTATPRSAPPRRRRTRTSSGCARRVSAQSPPRSCRRPSSTSPRSITSSTCRRTRTATAGSAARGSPAPWGTLQPPAETG
jgi:methionine-S-sulfoxide reductase